MLHPPPAQPAMTSPGYIIIQVPFAEWWRTFETRTFPGVDATFIHAFDDLDVMAGNGTIALELLEDLPEFDAVVVPWGGGGLTCGIAAVVKEERVRTYDMMRIPGGANEIRQGAASTIQMTDAVIGQLELRELACAVSGKERA